MFNQVAYMKARRKAAKLIGKCSHCATRRVEPGLKSCRICKSRGCKRVVPLNLMWLYK